MDDDKKRFYRHLNDQLHKTDDLDDHYRKDDSTTRDGGFNHTGEVRRLNGNAAQEVSVVRVALLKNGNFCVDQGNTSALFLHGAADEINDIANNSDQADWDDLNDD